MSAASGLGEAAVREFADPGLHDHVWRLVSSLRLLPEGGTVAVLGAGEGAFERALGRTRWRGHLHSYDLHPGRFRVPGIECRAADLSQSIPLADATVDFAVAIEVIEHLENPSRFLREAARVLRPGGCLLLTTPNVQSFGQRLRYLFGGRFNGFRQVDFEETGHLHPMFDWLLRRLVADSFEVERYDSHRFHLKLLPRLPGIPVPIRSPLFAVCNIYVLRKRPDPR